VSLVGQECENQVQSATEKESSAGAGSTEKEGTLPRALRDKSSEEGWRVALVCLL